MRRQISPNQTVLWPHHELTEAWAPTGIRHPAQTCHSPQQTATKNDRATEGRKALSTITARPSTGRRTSGRNRSQQDIKSKYQQVSTGTDSYTARPGGTRQKKIFFTETTVLTCW